MEIRSNRECANIPKLRIEMKGKRGVGIWLDGVYISRGVRSVTFSAEGSKESPVLNLSIDVGDFEFCPDVNLEERGKGSDAAVNANGDFQAF